MMAESAIELLDVIGELGGDGAYRNIIWLCRDAEQDARNAARRTRYGLPCQITTAFPKPMFARVPKPKPDRQFAVPIRKAMS